MKSQPLENFKPQLMDLLNLFKKDLMLNFHCHAIARVESFDSTKKTIQAKIMYGKTVYVDGKETLVEYPLLMDIPVIIMGGGAGRLTFPIAAGDECLILFNDRDIDNWMAGAKSGPVASARLHDFADGIALVGFLEVTSYDTTRVKLANGTTYVGISTSKVKIANNSTTLMTAINSLITALDTFATSTSAAATEPTLGPAATALKTTLGTVKTTFESLLE